MDIVGLLKFIGITIIVFILVLWVLGTLIDNSP
jgi:hypothetical protein